MSLPKEPRQLMINLMYLVLTALLAMNVSSEILNAFKTIGKSIDRSNKAQKERNEATTGAFDGFLEDPKASAPKKAKVEKAKLLVTQVNDKTNTLISQLEGYKVKIIEASGGYEVVNGVKQIKKIDDLDGGTHVMVEGGNGKKMLQAMMAYKEDLAGLVPLDWGEDVIPAGNGNNPEFLKKLPLTFEVEKNSENKGDWSIYNFQMSPTIATTTLIDKYISDIRASQAAALDEIWSKATGEPLDKAEIKKEDYIRTQAKPLPDYAVIVAADNNYVLPGERFTARIMLGTYNKKANNLSFTVNGQTIPVVEGIGQFSAIATNEIGPRQLNVIAKFTDTMPGNSTQLVQRTIPITKPAQYFVGESQATISLDKMNVFYVGVDNPITMSASGIQASKLTYSAENCTVTRDAASGVNKYIVRPTKAGQMAKITLFGELPDGSKKSWENKYRVKNIPDPYPVVAGKKGGAACANEIKVQEAIFAKLDAFDFDVKFEVISYEIFYVPKRGEPLQGNGRNNLLNGAVDQSVRAVIEKLAPGGKLYFDNIKVKMPDGRIRNVGSIVFNINC